MGSVIYFFGLVDTLYPFWALIVNKTYWASVTVFEPWINKQHNPASDRSVDKERELVLRISFDPYQCF